MIIYEQKKQQALQLFQTAIAFAHEHNNSQIEQFLTETMKRLVEEKLIVVVCGEFKQGKSSFINALLDEPGLCPVDVDIATSTVTSIAYGPQERIAVQLGEPGQPVKEEKLLHNRSEIAEYVTEHGNPRNVRRARLMTIQVPNKKLASGLVLVDTPGVGGLNSEHTDVAYAFLPSADVVLFVSDALEPLSAVEISFIKDRIARVCPNILFIVTKKDKNEDYQIIVEDNRQKLAVALDRPADEIPIIPVSNRAKLDYHSSGDQVDLQESNFPLLEEIVWSYLNEGRGRILLVKAAMTLSKAITDLALPIQTELDACREQDRKRLDEMERQMKEAHQRLQDLLENNAQWQMLLRDGLEDIQMRVSEQFTAGFSHIKHSIEGYLEQDSLRKEPERVVNLLSTDMSVLLTELERYIGSEAGKLQAQIEDETGLSLRAYKTHPFALVEQEHMPLTQEKEGLWRKGINVARNGALAGTGGATILGVIGGIAGAALGLLSGGTLVVPLASLGATIGASLGQIAGSVTGARQAIQQMDKQKRSEIARHLLIFVQNQEMAQATNLKKAIKDLERFLRDDFTAQLTRERKSVEEALRSLQQARKLTQEQSAARIVALTTLMKRIEQMRNVVEQLLRSAMSEKAIGKIPSGVGGTQSKQDTTFGGWADV